MKEGKNERGKKRWEKKKGNKDRNKKENKIKGREKIAGTKIEIKRKIR